MEPQPIELRGVTKSYEHFTLEKTDLTIPTGRMLGLIGPNGAGKSTLLRILMGLVRADAGAELLTRLALNPDQRVRGMSRGQQVKAMLLLALARRASVLILDEPTAGLDPLVRHEVIQLLAAYRDERQVIVFSSHHGADVAALADEVVFLHAGRILAQAPVADFLGGGRTLETAFLERVSRVTEGRAA